MFNKNRFWSIVNFILCLAMISLNGVAGSKGLFGKTVGEISDSLPNLFTPAGYAFSIWSIIFLTQVILSVQLVQSTFKENQKESFLPQMRFYALVHILNMSWILSWHSLNIGMSVLIMMALLLVLSYIFIKNKALSKNLLLKNSTELYYGWICVATIANITAFLSQQGWNLYFNASTWAIIMILMATALYIIMVIRETTYVFSLVGIWAILAIAFKQFGQNEVIFWTALVGAAMILISIPFKMLRSA